MVSTRQPLLDLTLVVKADHGQIFVRYQPPDDDRSALASAEEDAFDLAMDNRHYIAATRGVIVITTPEQWNPRVPLAVQLWPDEPADDRDQWDHEVDLDAEIQGPLTVYTTGGTPLATVDTITPGPYRIRVSAADLTPGALHALTTSANNANNALKADANNRCLRPDTPCANRSNPAMNQESEAAVIQATLVNAGFASVTVRPATTDDPAPPGGVMFAAATTAACVLGY